MDLHQGSGLGKLLRDLPSDATVRLESIVDRWDVTVTRALGPVTFRIAASDPDLSECLNRAHMKAMSLLDTAGIPTLEDSVFHQAREALDEPEPPGDPHLDRGRPLAWAASCPYTARMALSEPPRALTVRELERMALPSTRSAASWAEPAGQQARQWFESSVAHHS